MSDELGLCHRCEHRARVLEGGTAPRCECGVRDRAVYCCYMYRPVAPLVLAPVVGETRDILAPAAFSGRARAVRVYDGGPVFVTVDDGAVILFDVKRSAARGSDAANNATRAATPGGAQEDRVMTCEKCGKKVRGRPSPSGLCKECRGVQSAPPCPPPPCGEPAAGVPGAEGDKGVDADTTA